MGEPVHAARAVAVPLDLGDGVPPRARLGVLGDVAAGGGPEPQATASELEDLRRRIAELESTIKAGGD